MTAFIASLLFVTLAEMGDKTQLLAMTFATRVPVKTVLADGFGIIIGIVLGKRIPDAVIRLVSAGIFIFFGLAGAATVLPAWLPLAGSTVVLFALTVVTLAAAHYLIIQRRRQDAQPQTPRAARGVLDRLSQSLFALLLLIGWVASLGLATPLAAYGHWITFVLLGGLGWKLIHGAVRSGRVPLRIRSPLIYSILILAALTSTQAFLAGFPISLAIVRISVLLSAVALLVCTPFLARHTTSDRLRRIGRHRIEIASGLVLIGIALKVLIEHLA